MSALAIVLLSAILLILFASCTEKVYLPPMQGVDKVKITVAPSEPMDKDDTFQLTVEGMSSSSVTWTSSDTDVVTVSPDGKVTAVGPGVAEITAEYDGKVSEPVEITVSGIAIETGFGTSLSSGTTDNTITLKAYGNADLSGLAATSTIEPSGAVTLTPTTGSDGSIIYTVSTTATLGDVTINFGGDSDPITFTIVSEELKVSIDGEKIVTGIKGGDKAEIDLSGKLADGEEIATIKDSEGNVLYDVNDPESADKDVVYDPEDKALTVNVGDANNGNIDIVAEKVKVLLYDAILKTNGKTYTRPTLNNSNLKGKYSLPSEAYTAATEMKMNNVYIRLLSDIQNDSIIGKTAKITTIDLNGKTWQYGKPGSKEGNNQRILWPQMNSGDVFNIIEGTITGNNLGAGTDALGAAIYAQAAVKGTISDWNNNNRSAWNKLNLFDLVLSNNYADCGDAICLQGAVELNAYNTKFIGNESRELKQSNETGTGAAIYVWSPNTQGEVVNLYECTFESNKGNGIISVEYGPNPANLKDVLFNIYSATFDNNTLIGASPSLISVNSINLYGGNIGSDATLNLYADSNSININGGIVGNVDINGNCTQVTLRGGSAKSIDSEINNIELATATLDTAAKVEYITYGTTNTVNINSPFNVTADGVVYSYESGYSSASGDVYNNSEFNPEITEFGIFLPADSAESIDSITVHCAGGETVKLTRDSSATGIAFVEK